MANNNSTGTEAPAVFQIRILSLPKLRTLHDRLLLAMILKPSPPIKIILDFMTNKK